MGFLASAFSGPSRELSQNILDLIKGTSAYAGVWSGSRVTKDTAIGVSTVFACMRVIADGIAQVPFKLMIADESGRIRKAAKTHSLYDILASSPNAWQTSFEFREQIGMHCVLAGNFYAFIARNTRGQIIELIPLDPNNVEVKRGSDFDLTYWVTGDNGARREFPADSIWHIKGPSWSGWEGLEVVKVAREAIGLGIAIERGQASMHKNGVKESGTYSVSGTLKPDQYKVLQDWIATNMGGAENAGKPMVIDRDAKWLSTSMSSVDSQTLETRRYQVEEICRFCKVNPIMVGAESKNTTYASAEQMFLAHVVHTLAPWFTRLEQSADKYLLTKAERAAGYYFNFVEEGLLRGSAQATRENLRAYVDGGIMSANEARDKLDMAPDASEDSDKLIRSGSKEAAKQPAEAPK